MRRRSGAASAARALAAMAAVAIVGAPNAAAPPDGQKTIVHVLNRIGFGPRPGDIERIQTTGLQRYIDQQLRPERLPDPGMAARLAGLTSVGLSSHDIAAQYARPLIEARRQQRPQQNPADETPMMQRPRDLPNLARQKANLVVVELAEQKLLRAIYSDRQLEEVLVDFWFNHFNVDARKGRVRFLLTEYERDAIRPHVLGRFRDLLEATAKSPAMLFYLDNWMSADPNQVEPDQSARRAPPDRRRTPRTGPGAAPASPGQQRSSPSGARRGLNENYARELMELHTLGVDGGYTQTDVTEVARAFTGWTIESPRVGAAFRFEPRLHDDGAKVVLGHAVRAGGGVRDGEQVLDILAGHPSTARFISTKLARRFVSDAPPAALIDRLAARFVDTRGDLRSVMALLLASPEFLAPEAYRAKVKTPFEFVVSAVRATGAQLSDTRPLVQAMQHLGMPLYQCQPPTGYKDTADAWANAGALVNRMNFAVAISEDARVADARTTIEELLAHDLSETTRATIARAATPAQARALTLGSPEFQRR